jgi:hypothetical protein
LLLLLLGSSRGQHLQAQHTVVLHQLQHPEARQQQQQQQQQWCSPVPAAAQLEAAPAAACELRVGSSLLGSQQDLKQLVQHEQAT